jgi:flagellar motility protein MotE (MotC chaperone)
MFERSRLIPAVILGAVGLLALKVISWSGATFTPLADQVAPQTARVGPDGSYNPNDFRGVTQMWARAREPYVIQSPEVTGSVEKKDDKAPAAAPQQPMPPEANIRDRSSVLNTGQRAMSPAERALVERLGERREEIDSRQRELDMREKLLETAERKLDGRVGELKAQEDRLEAQKGEKETAEAQGLKKLVIMYENMKPRDAARVFDRLPSEVLVPVVLQMNPRKMSEVLAAMTPQTAEKLTVALANRARARTDGLAAAPPAPLSSTELPAIAPVGQPAGQPAGQQPARRP